MELRDGTQDALMYEEVVEQNEYQLPDHFAPEDVVIDVGANIGAFAFACLKRGCGKVVCFEPEAANFALLRRNLAGCQEVVETHQVAVWRSDRREVTYLQHAGLQLTAMHRLAPCGVEVPNVGLDEILDRFPAVRFLKIDAEGAEYPILFTALNLGRVQEVAVEVHLQALPPGWPVRKTGLGMTEAFLVMEGFTVDHRHNPHCHDRLAIVSGVRRNDGHT